MRRGNRCQPRSSLLTLLATAMLVTAGSKECRAQEVVTLLTEKANLSSGELKKLENGEAVVKVFKSEDDREVTVFSVIRIQVPIEFLLERVLEVQNFLARDETMLQVGVIGGEPGPEDFSKLALPDGDIESLKKCRVGKCDVKLPAGAIEALHQQVDWSQPDYARQANAFMARKLALYLEQYVSRGNDALATYDDKSEPLSVADGFETLLARTRYLIEYDQPFHTHLRDYPASRAAGTEDTFYWALEDFGLKPTLTLNHVAVKRRPAATLTEAIVGEKQIYASHYFQAALNLIHVVSVSKQDPSRGLYLTRMVRQRYDGKVGGIKRSQLERGLKKKSAEHVAVIKAHLEKSYRGSRGG